MNKKKVILMLGTYPIRKGVHGGQRRAKALKAAYERAGYKVVYSAIFNRKSYPSAGEYTNIDLPSPNFTEKKVQESPIKEDIILGFSVYEDPTTRTHVSKLIKKYKPLYISLEQPYIYLGLKQLLEEVDCSAEIINSSQNIEYEMKKDIYAQHSDVMTSAEAKKTVDIIKRLECDIARKAHLSIAVSDSDANKIRNMGAKRVLTIPNGINVTPASIERQNKWKRYFAERGVNRLILFTGSAHPPNWKGFFAMMGSRLGYIPFDTRIVMVGDIGPAIAYALTKNEPVYGGAFWSRAVSMGRLSDEDLSALIAISKLIILPITEGGGSNLKTAEAIASGKTIVATKHALRGYDEYVGDDKILIAKNADEFKSLVVSALEKNEDTHTHVLGERETSVLWEQRTEPLVEFFRKASK